MHSTSPPAWHASALAEALKRIRDCGYSASDLAKLAGISRSQMSRWSSGGHRPSYDAMRSLTTALMTQHPSPEQRENIMNLCIAAGYPEILADLAFPTFRGKEDAEPEDAVSPYSGAVWRIVRSLEARAEDAGLSDEEEREMIERAMENAERQAEMMFDAELRRREHPDAES